MDVAFIQRQLERLDIDGWLLYDFQGMNPLARQLAGRGDRMLTRRWFCLVPREGEPVWLVSRVEERQFGDVSGIVRTYLSWTTLEEELADLVADCRRVAMEYVPQGTIPYVSRVDAGTLEMVRATGVEIISSADLVQWCQARWSPAALATHLEASTHLNAAKDGAFDLISARVSAGEQVSEYDVQQQILRYFAEHGLITNGPPIVAAGRNTRDPHYQPTAESSAVIEEGDLILVDLWAKLNRPGAVYADITWMGYVGAQVPAELARVFAIVTHARDVAAAFVQSSVAGGETIRGYQVDDVARTAIAEAGFGDYFIHRTGHNIGTEDHGTGVNFDNLETHDERLVIPDITCSIEPGVYVELFGMRSELNIHVGERRAEITTVPVQRRIIPLLGGR